MAFLNTFLWERRSWAPVHEQWNIVRVAFDGTKGLVWVSMTQFIDRTLLTISTGWCTSSLREKRFLSRVYKPYVAPTADISMNLHRIQIEESCNNFFHLGSLVLEDELDAHEARKLFSGSFDSPIPLALVPKSAGLHFWYVYWDKTWSTPANVNTALPFPALVQKMPVKLTCASSLLMVSTKLDC